ncbi:MAG: acetylglutamate kinase [Ignavibacteriaceae bacterium]
MKIIIVKLSGKILNSFSTDSKWIDIIKEIKKEYDGLVLVHGGGNKITEWSAAMNIDSQFIRGHRVTDDKTIEIVAAIQSGLLNTKIVASLQSKGINASGFTGIDQGLFLADYLDKELGFVGNPKLNQKTDWLLSLIEQNIIPVFSSLCSDKDGNLMNVNADLFTKEIALALNADTVLFLSDVEAVKLNGEAKSYLTYNDILDGIEQNEITEGMIPKLKSCLELIDGGINKVWIGNDLTNFNFNNLSGKNNAKGSWITNRLPVAV